MELDLFENTNSRSREKPKVVSYKEALREAVLKIMEENPKAIVFGQGVNDPTGIFGSTKGLAERFGSGRVLDLPICEEGATGLMVGAALNGCYPIQTHIRVDFLVLAMNQMLNIISKYKYMYGGSFELPMLIRCIVGRSWGQGPQHSQSLQALFSHAPGLKVIMPSHAVDAARGYVKAAREFRGPVLSIEHRFLYDMDFTVDDAIMNRDPFSARLVTTGDAVTIVATSYMVQEAQKAAKWLKERNGIEVEIIDPVEVSNLDEEMILKSVTKTGRLIVADTSWVSYGVCAEVARVVAMRNPQALKRPMISLGMAKCPAPTSHVLEKYYYPDMGTIVDSVHELVLEKNKTAEKPSEEFKRTLGTKFRGPF